MLSRPTALQVQVARLELVIRQALRREGDPAPTLEDCLALPEEDE